MNKIKHVSSPYLCLLSQFGIRFHRRSVFMLSLQSVMLPKSMKTFNETEISFPQCLRHLTIDLNFEIDGRSNDSKFFRLYSGSY